MSFNKRILIYFSVNLCITHLNGYSNRDKKYEIKRNFVDIYTNHPYTSEVMDSYRNTDFYKNPQHEQAYTIHRSDSYKDWRYPTREDDQEEYVYPSSRFGKSKKDELYSDFGTFEERGRRNDSKGNYNFVFDDDKNLVYVEPTNTGDGDGDGDEKYVHLESQKFNLPNVGVHLSKRPSFQTAKKPDVNAEETSANYPETVWKPPTRHEKQHDILDGKFKFNDILRKFMIKLNKNNLVQNHDDVSDNSISSTNNSPVVIGEILNPQVVDAGLVPEAEQLPEADKSKFLEVPLKKLKQKTLSIANKLFSLFTIVQFPNSRCLANSATSAYEGTCYHANECALMNGTAMGNCAKGFGVCCVFRGTCGGTSDRNCTYFESPGYPNYYPTDPAVLPPNFNVSTPSPIPGLTPDPRIQYTHLRRYKRQFNAPNTLSCIFRVYKSSPNVQQMRIDFIDLELTGPTNGTCANERLVISGFTINNVPAICGYNTGQHVYVDVSGLIGPLQVQVLATMVQRKRFKLRICQYANTCMAAMGCLQYHTGVSGVISSFNYDKAAIYSRSDPAYFNNLNYAICIRREPGYCSITYSNVNNGVEYPFQLINFINGVMTVRVGEAGVEIFNCPNDYIVINGLRLCGYKLNDGSTVMNFSLNAPVTDTSGGPIVIPVRTNGMNVGRGFQLFYMQNRCLT